ncbi:hypothetical protein [Mycolicibacterium phocaicum]|uniref:hypothetical protein n=1 Tax=Mycolicibacterium phocaicum TaxID=319706 RepID=UPI001CFB9387|nr:hypothetical protein [Mycolicibacterium phocaicum]UCZ58682.1 hypothetical protein LHJ73_18070 [Mycolicibacterium phocaicum]
MNATEDGMEPVGEAPEVSVRTASLTLALAQKLLEANGYAVVQLPTRHLDSDGINMAWSHASYWHRTSETDESISIHGVHRYMDVSVAESLAADLLAAIKASRDFA